MKCTLKTAMGSLLLITMMLLCQGCKTEEEHQLTQQERDMNNVSISYADIRITRPDPNKQEQAYRVWGRRGQVLEYFARIQERYGATPEEHEKITYQIVENLHKLYGRQLDSRNGEQIQLVRELIRYRDPSAFIELTTHLLDDASVIYVNGNITTTQAEASRILLALTDVLHTHSRQYLPQTYEYPIVVNGHCQSFRAWMPIMLPPCGILMDRNILAEVEPEKLRAEDFLITPDRAEEHNRNIQKFWRQFHAERKEAMAFLMPDWRLFLRREQELPKLWEQILQGQYTPPTPKDPGLEEKTPDSQPSSQILPPPETLKTPPPAKTLVPAKSKR